MVLFSLIISEHTWLPQIFFSDSAFPAGGSYEPRKNIAVLAGTAVKKRDFLILSRDVQNVCALAKVGSVL